MKKTTTGYSLKVKLLSVLLAFTLIVTNVPMQVFASDAPTAPTAPANNPPVDPDSDPTPESDSTPATTEGAIDGGLIAPIVNYNVGGTDEGDEGEEDTQYTLTVEYVVTDEDGETVIKSEDKNFTEADVTAEGTYTFTPDTSFTHEGKEYTTSGTAVVTFDAATTTYTETITCELVNDEPDAPTTYTVSFYDANGGLIGEPAEVEENEAFPAVPSMAKAQAGYFGGWSDTADGSFVTFPATVESNLEFHAVYVPYYQISTTETLSDDKTEVTVAVTIEANDKLPTDEVFGIYYIPDTISQATESKEEWIVPHDDNWTALTATYVFNYEDFNKLSNGYVVYKNIQIYTAANFGGTQWLYNVGFTVEGNGLVETADESTGAFSVTFNYGDETKIVKSVGGKISATAATAADANTQVANYMNTTRPIPEGHGFIGWFDENGNEVDDLTTLTKATTLTAKYEPVAWASIDIIEYSKKIKNGDTIESDYADFYHVVHMNKNVVDLELRSFTILQYGYTEGELDADGNRTFRIKRNGYLPSEKGATFNYSIPGVSNGAVSVKATATIDTDPTAPGLSSLLATMDVENQSFVVTYEGNSDTAPTGTMTYGSESESFTMTGTAGAWEAKILVSDVKYDGMEIFSFAVNGETTDLGVYEIHAFKDNYGTENNEVFATYYVLGGSNLMEVLPSTQEEFEEASGRTLSDDQRLAVGTDTSKNAYYSWYYKADNKFQEVDSNTKEMAINADHVASGNKEVYPVVLSKIVFNDENGEPIDIYHHLVDLTEAWLWTDFLGSVGNVYTVSTHSIPDTNEPNSLGYEWKLNGNEYTDTEIPTMNLLSPVTFEKGDPAVPKIPFEGVEIIWSDADTKNYLIEAIRTEKTLTADDTIEITSPTEFNVIWEDAPNANGGFESDDLATQVITYTVNGTEETINARIYPRYVMINRMDVHVAVQGSNTLVDYEDHHNPHGYYMELITGDMNGIFNTPNAIYSDFYKNSYVEAYENQPVLGFEGDWTPRGGENIMSYSHSGLDIVYKGVGELYQQTADEQKQNVTTVDTSALANYYVYENQSGLVVFAADNFSASKVWDGAGYTIDADVDADENGISDFLEAVYGDIGYVADKLEDGQKLVARFPSSNATEGVNFESATYTSPSPVGVYTESFKIFVAEEVEVDGVMVWKPIAGETASVFSDDNAYTATITITSNNDDNNNDDDEEEDDDDDDTTIITPPVIPFTPTPVGPEVVITPPVVPFTPAPPVEPATTEPTTPDPVIIPEPTPPLAPAPAETVIGEPEIPMVAAPGAAWALINLILTILTGLITLALFITYFSRKKEEEEEDENGNVKVKADDEEEEETEKRKGLLRLLSIIPTITAIVVFILTEDMRNPMILIDKYTWIMAVIALVQLAVAYFSRKEDEEDEEDENVTPA